MLVILADRLIDGTGRAPVDRPAIVVRDGRIERVQSRGSGWVPPAGATVVDEPGATALPGFVDAHCHLAFRPPEKAGGGEPGGDPDPGGTPRAALRNASSAVRAGVTTLRDLGGPAWVTLEARDALEASGEGPRVAAAGPMITTRTGHCHWLGIHADTRKELIGAVERVADAGVDWVKIMGTGGMLTPGSHPDRLQYPVDDLVAAVRRAHQLGLPVAMHALSSAAIRAAIRAGVDTLEHGWTITGRAQDRDRGVIRALAASGIAASVTAHVALRSLLARSDGEADVDELRRRLEPHRELADAGGRLVVHSDAGTPGTGFEGFAQSVEAFALGMEATPVEAIHAATGLAADAIGRDDVGTVQPGRRADLLLVEGDASREIKALRRLRRVFVDGRPVVTHPRPPES